MSNAALAYDSTVTAAYLIELCDRKGQNMRMFCGDSTRGARRAEPYLDPVLAVVAAIRFPTLDLAHFERCRDCALRLRQMVDELSKAKP